MSGAGHVRDLERYRALADVVRLQIVEALQVRQELTTAQLMKITGTRSLAYHLRTLAAAGVVERVGPAAKTKTRWRMAPDDSDTAVVAWDQPGDEDAEMTAAIRALERVTTYRRVDRMRTFDDEVRRGDWPEEWASAAVGRDYLYELTLDQMQELERQCADVLAQMRKWEDQNRERGVTNTKPVFATLAAFPVIWGDE